MFTDIVSHVKVEHRFLKVLQAFLEGHVISVGGSDYRYAAVGHELYKKSVDDENEMVLYATKSGIFKRNFSFGSASPVEMITHGNTDVPESANGFLWMIHSESAIEEIKSLYESMSDQEITLAISNLAFDHVQNKR